MQSRRLLKHIDSLTVIAERHQQDRLIKLFASAFQEFNCVVDQAFGKQLDSDFETSIKRFQVAYMKIGITVTTAVHIIFVHLRQFCKLKKTSLAFYSEQASEAVHSDFSTLWTSSGKVNESHKDFGKKILDCTIRYNSRHI